MTSTSDRRTLMVEGLVIVASILVAFAIDRGYERWQERAEESAILDGLVADFTGNRSTIESHLEWYDRWDRSIAEVLEYSSGARSSGEFEDLATSFRHLYANPTLDLRTATLDLVEASGSGRLLGDRELRVLLAEWRVHATDAMDQQQGLQRNREQMVWPVLASMDLRMPDGIRMAVDPAADLPTPSQSRGARLPSALDVHSGILSRTRRDWDEVMDATNRILQRLDALGVG